jgi:hypothetical protein
MQVDITQILIAAIGGIFSVLSIIMTAWIQAHVKDNKMRNLLECAVQRSLGALQQASDKELQQASLSLKLPAEVAFGVQYVCTHAQEALDHYGITPEHIAEKIQALIGLKAIEINKAVAASSTPIIPKPLDKVPPKELEEGKLPVVPTVVIPIDTPTDLKTTS